jgi:hypothetical protein
MWNCGWNRKLWAVPQNINQNGILIIPAALHHSLFPDSLPLPS